MIFMGLMPQCLLILESIHCFVSKSLVASLEMRWFRSAALGEERPMKPNKQTF